MFVSINLHICIALISSRRGFVWFEIMDEKQKTRKAYRALPSGCYHLCTDGWKEGKLFHTDHHYIIGMASIAMLTILCGITIYAFELMPNHVHIIMKGTGEQAIKAFGLLVKRINKCLSADGYPTLPPKYGFKLIPIDNRASFRQHVIYLARNPYEKGICIPGGNPWGSGYLLFNKLGTALCGTKISEMKKVVLYNYTNSRISLPPHWEVHPQFGILPKNFVNTVNVINRFSSVKDYLTVLIKDYESFVRISDSVGEKIEFSIEEVRDIISEQIRKDYPGQRLTTLTNEAKCRIASYLFTRYGIDTVTLSASLNTPERIIIQAINSKDIGLKPSSTLKYK